MPIRLTCTACSKPMQAPDAAAGKRVKCPNCQAVVSVPAASAAAPAAPAPALPPPVPPPAPAPAAPAQGDNPFGFDDAPAKKPKRPARDERDEGDDERPAKKKGRARDRDEDDEEEWEGPAPRKGAKGWSAFGSGCGTVKIGLWIEFAAIVYFSILLFVAVTSTGRGSPFGSGLALLPVPLVMLAGTGCILVGRLKMMSAPKSTGASTVLLGAVLLTGLRGIAVLAGTVFAVLAVAGDGFTSAMYGSRAAAALVIGAAPGAVAELTVVVAMALAGGCIPDENLRRKSGLLTFVTQMCALAYFVLVTLVLLTGLDDIGPRPAPRPGQFGQPRGGPPIDSQTLAFIVIFVYLLLQLVYTALQASMYSAAQSATGSYTKRKPKFEDDEE